MLYSFTANDNGNWPEGGLVFDEMGNLYGTATEGGPVGGGTVFRLARRGKSWVVTALYSFKVYPDGSYPVGDLTLDEFGDLYGVTQDGVQNCYYGCGTVFEVSP